MGIWHLGLSLCPLRNQLPACNREMGSSPDVRGPLWGGRASLYEPSPRCTRMAPVWDLPGPGSLPQPAPGGPLPHLCSRRPARQTLTRIPWHQDHPPTLRPRELGALMPTRWRDTPRNVSLGSVPPLSPRGTEFSPRTLCIYLSFIPIPHRRPAPIANHLYAFL